MPFIRYLASIYLITGVILSCSFYRLWQVLIIPE